MQIISSSNRRRMELTECIGFDGPKWIWRNKIDLTAKWAISFSSPRLDSSIFWGGMSNEEVILHYYGPTSMLISSNRKLLQLLSFPHDQFSAQPMIRYMDHNGCSANFYLWLQYCVFTAAIISLYWQIISLALMRQSQSMLQWFSICLCKAISLLDPSLQVSPSGRMHWYC